MSLKSLESNPQYRQGPVEAVFRKIELPENKGERHDGSEGHKLPRCLDNNASAKHASFDGRKRLTAREA